MLNMSPRDLRSLLVPLMALVAVIAVSAIAISYSGKLVKRGVEELSAQERQLNEARHRVTQSDAEKGLIERFVRNYTQLEHAGIVGEEQRISWIDALRIANSEADLYGVSYDVSAQQAYAFSAEANAGSVTVRQSIMKLHFDLLHEEDLLRFFQSLKDQKVGRFAVNECKLQRLNVDVTVPVNQPTLSAECEVAWITIAGAGSEERKL